MGHTDCQSVWPYGLLIRMSHTNQQFICISHTSSSLATKIDQNPPYTPRMYTTGEQIRFQTILNESNVHWVAEKNWRCRNKKNPHAIYNLRVFLAFMKFVGCSKQFPKVNYVVPSCSKLSNKLIFRIQGE